MFANFGKRNLSKSFQDNSREDSELKKAIDGIKPGPKDDMDVKPVYDDNQFWTKPE